MVNTEKLIGTKEYRTLDTRSRVQRCRFNRVSPYLCGPQTFFSIDLAPVAKRLLITGVNDIHSKMDTVQQALEYVWKKRGYVCNHTARYEVLTVMLMKIYKYSGMFGDVLFRSSVVLPSSR